MESHDVPHKHDRLRCPLVNKGPLIADVEGEWWNKQYEKSPVRGLATGINFVNINGVLHNRPERNSGAEARSGGSSSRSASQGGRRKK